MSVTIEANELPILLEELDNRREVWICRRIVLEGIVICFLMGLLGLGTLIQDVWKFEIFKVDLWMWAILGLVIISSRMVSHFIVKFVLFILKLNRFCRVRVLFFVTKEKNNLQRFFWTLIIFTVWCILTYHLVKIETKIKRCGYLTFGLLMLMISCFAWLTMSILLKVHKIRCLNRIYFERVTKSILEQCIIKMFVSSPEHQNHQISTFDDLSQLNKKEVTACIIDKLTNMVGDKSLPSIEAVVTKSIHRNLIELDSNHVENIKKFLSNQSALIINFFEGDKINEKALDLWVVSVYKDRRTLVSNMKQTITAITKQHLVVQITVPAILIISTGCLMWSMYMSS